MPLDKNPIIVIGAGRSGTTLLFNLLYKHPQLSWPCQFMVNKWYNRNDRWVLRLERIPLIGEKLKFKLRRRRAVSEPYDIWTRYFKGFNRPFRDLTETDVNKNIKENLPKDIRAQQIIMGKERFITKYTGWSRIRFVETIFPNACYINIVRDGRAVAYSLMSQKWWRGWFGPYQWRWGILTDEDKEIFNNSGKSFFILAGLHWKILMTNICEEGRKIGSRYSEVRYEELVKNPEKNIKNLLKWLNLDEDRSYLKIVRNTNMLDANKRWREQLPISEQERFNHLLGPTLVRFGYDTAL